MSEEKTQGIPDSRSFEERVFARFDALDRRFDSLEARVQKLEEGSERRAVETKPIWERALAEIVEGRQDLNVVRQDVSEIKEVLKKLSKKIDVNSVDMVQLRADLRDHEDRLDKLEAEPTR